MGRLTEFFDFINRPTMPTKLQQEHLYSHIAIDDELKRIRKEYIKEIKSTLRISEGGSRRVKWTLF